MAERLRFRFTKLGKIRFTSQRDVARMWERALRRSGLEIALSQGFNPRPLLAFGLALPTGAESLAEYLDATVAADVPSDLVGFGASLTALLPDGLAVSAVGVLSDAAGSLQQEVTSCSWELEVLGVTASELATRVGRLLDAPSVSVRRERKGRTFDDDLRPSVRSLGLTDPAQDAGTARGQSCWLRAETATRPRGVRPRELVEALGTDVVLARARRTQQWIEHDGSRREPLPVGEVVTVVTAPHAIERAS